MRIRHGRRRFAWRQSGVAAGLVCAAIALAGTAGSASAAPASDSVRANGSISNGNGTFDSFAVYARSGPLGERPSGSVFVDAVFISRESGATLGNGTVRGDVSEGCLVAAGNRAVVLGKLREPFTLTGPGTVEYVGVTVEDNGEPVDGQPVDRGEVWFLPASAATQFCTTGFFLNFATRPLVDGYVEIVDSLP